MSDTYIAWNGDEYPMPPPDGWEIRSDGRYWPSDSGPADSTPEPAPVPAPQPGPSAGGPSMPGPPTAGPSMPGPPTASPSMPAPPTAGPSPGSPVPPPGPGGVPADKSNTGLIILLSILGVIVLMVGGCVVAIAGFFNTASDAIDEFEESLDEFEQNQLEARAEVSITEGGCRIVDGVPTATVRIANRSGGRSDYNVSVIFSDASGRRLQEGFADIDNVNHNDDVLVDVSSSQVGVEGSLECDIGDVTRYAAALGTN